MKTLKISVLAMFVVFALFSCNKDDEDSGVIPVPDNPDKGQSFHGNFTLVVEEQYVSGDPETLEIKSHMEGKGDLNLMSPSILELDHLTEIRKIKGEHKIKDGTFRIWSESGAEIFGEYESIINQGEITQIFAYVQGGYGSFKGVRGDLTIQLQQISLQERNAVVHGRLFNYAPSSRE